MTRLDAVSEILLSINELPIDIDDDIQNVHIASIVNKHLNIAKRKILKKGWYFNEYSVELSPDINGHISVSENYLSVDGGTDYPNVIMRDWKLFDKDTFSYVFDGSLTIDVIENMDFEDIPSESLASYIVATALMSAYTAIIGYTNEIKLHAENLVNAKIDALRDDANNTDGNVLLGTFTSILSTRS